MQIRVLRYAQNLTRLRRRYIFCVVAKEVSMPGEFYRKLLKLDVCNLICFILGVMTVRLKH